VTLSSAADHDTTGTSALQYPLRFLWGIDIAVGDNRDLHGACHLTNGFEFRFAIEAVGAGAAMNGQRLNAGLLGDARDHYRVAVVAGGAGADFQGDRY